MANAPSDAIQRLIDLVAQLRDPTTGCPWDLEQTHASLVPYVLEEAHEVADAIRQGSNASRIDLSGYASSQHRRFLKAEAEQAPGEPRHR